ncbi:MAG: 16S rRNA (uracil(1498)-N(3))-methyltransferase [Lachnospiraceae bacterium]|nr:16S rRNA (uracil(1498)-N(3))-methyltransferase [Lachnospiraceae bacterium]
MFHFFVTKEQVSDGRIRITGADLNHVKNALRMKAGEHVKISDGENRTYECVLSGYPEGAAEFEILSESGFTSELPMKITLFQGLPKGDKMEWITEKAVELGVSMIVPVAMHRSVVKLDAKKEEARIRRYQAIAGTAAKQAGRNVIPGVTPVVSVEAAARMAEGLDVLLVPYECAEDMAKTRQVLENLPKEGRVGMVIGPEGGFELAEIERFKAAGGRVITLGKRILRTETAGLYLLSVLSFLYGE